MAVVKFPRRLEAPERCPKTRSQNQTRTGVCILRNSRGHAESSPCHPSSFTRFFCEKVLNHPFGREKGNKTSNHKYGDTRFITVFMTVHVLQREPARNDVQKTKAHKNNDPEVHPPANCACFVDGPREATATSDTSVCHPLTYLGQPPAGFFLPNDFFTALGQFFWGGHGPPFRAVGERTTNTTHYSPARQRYIGSAMRGGGAAYRGASSARR